MRKFIPIFLSSILIAYIGGCSRECPIDNVDSSGPIIVGNWQVEYLMGQDNVKKPNKNSAWGIPFICFSADGKINGNSGVNLFGGKYKIQNNKLSFSEMFSTRRAGEFDEYERLFLNALAQIDSFALNGDLSLMQNGKILLKLKRKTREETDK